MLRGCSLRVIKRKERAHSNKENLGGYLCVCAVIRLSNYRLIGTEMCGRPVNSLPDLPVLMRVSSL